MTLPVDDHEWQPLVLPAHQDSKWLLLRTRLRCKGPRGQTRLRLHYGDGQQAEFCLPVSRKGTLLEWVAVSGTVTAAWLLPASQSHEVSLDPVQVRWIRGVEAWLRTWRRVGPMLYRQPRQIRQRIGLTAGRLWRDWACAQRLASQLRDDRPRDDYQHWLAQFDELTSADEREIRRQIRCWRHKPLIQVLICEHSDASACQRTLDSLEAQWYPAYQCRIIPAGSQSEYAPDSGWYLLLPAGAVLAPHALYWFAACVRKQPQLRWLYSDHDLLDAHGWRHHPVFKPDWSPTLLHSQNYIGWSGLWWAQRGEQLPTSGAALYLRWLQLSQGLPARAIAHLPALLVQIPPEAHVAASAEEARVVATDWLGVKAQSLVQGCWRIRYRLPASLPTVSLIIPTRNALSHLQPCLLSLLEKTDYAPFEVIIVDNQSDDAATLTYLEQVQSDPRVRVIRYDLPFNYSAINNLAVQAAQGELVCLLNNDTEVIAADWLREMVSHLLRDGVGVVGAKLYYGDGTVQHGGDAVGPGGCADHLHHRLPGDTAGYCQRALCAQELSAVTGACLLTHRSLYQQLGGLNAQDLPVAFNDVDYCLRVQEAGYRVVWTPHAELYHHESVSRGKDLNPFQQARAASELAYMRRRWKQRLLHDPFYNPNLSYDRSDFSLSKAPRVSRPWEE